MKINPNILLIISHKTQKWMSFHQDYIYTTLSIFLRSLLVLCTGKQNTLMKLFKQMYRIITVCYRQEMRPNMGTFVFVVGVMTSISFEVDRKLWVIPLFLCRHVIFFVLYISAEDYDFFGKSTHVICYYFFIINVCLYYYI
jgi:hypothetical protein